MILYSFTGKEKRDVRYKPLNIRTLWRGTALTTSKAGANNSMKMNTEAGYGWENSETEIRKEWIRTSPILYEVEVRVNNSTHTIWIEEEQINVEITNNVEEEKDQEVTREREEDLIGNDVPGTPNYNNKLYKLLSLQIFNETELIMTEEEASCERKRFTIYI